MMHPEPAGFLATPNGGGGRGLIVLHAWWGLNENVKALCVRLANEGFIAFGPDLYGGKIATTIEDAETLSGELDEAQTKSTIADAIRFMSARPDVSGPGLGLIGLSLGVYFALGLSEETPDHVRAVVIFYGNGGGDFARSRASYLGHFAETDAFESADDVSGLEARLLQAGRPVTFHHYPGTGHWFFEADRSDAYNEAAATLAWERTVAFLKTEMPL